MLNLRFSAFVVFIGLGALGCSSDPTTPNETGGRGGSGGSTGGSGGTTGGSGGGDSGCPKFDYTNYNPSMSPTLKNDIQPILTFSCALSSSCHQTGSKQHPLLGPSNTQLDGGKPSDAQLMEILTELKKPSTEAMARNIVVPNKPEDSYLMDKLDGTNACSGFTCMGALGCGTQMPAPGQPLEKQQLDLIRAWIKKGALL